MRLPASKIPLPLEYVKDKSDKVSARLFKKPFITKTASASFLINFSNIFLIFVWLDAREYSLLF